MPDRLKRKEELTSPHWTRLHSKRPENGEPCEGGSANVDRGLSVRIAIHDLPRYLFKTVSWIAARWLIIRCLLPLLGLEGHVESLLHRREGAYVLITQLVGVDLLEGVRQFGKGRRNLLRRSAVGQTPGVG
jgi:hypothetical protein